MQWRTADILKTLIEFPTVSRDSNLELIAWIESFLAELGTEVYRVDDPDEPKAGLFASIGPSGEGGVLLSSHSDVVPIDGNNWSSDPFRLRQSDGRFFGRGACDMKGFLAASLAAVERASSMKLAEPLKLSISYDEEIGCVGVKKMVPHLDDTIGRASVCLIGEPTGMSAVIGHKGKLVIRATCTGTNGHSSMAPRYLNALHLATDLVVELRAMQAERQEAGPFDRAYPMPHSTLHAGRLTGGTALNVVPDRAVIDLELRYLPQEDPEEVLADLRERAARIAARYRDIHPKASIEIEVVTAYPALATGAKDPVVDWLKSHLSQAKISKVDFGTEAGVFARAGMAAVVCGPGDITDAHKPNESIAADQLRQCDTLLSRINDSLADR